MAMMNEMEYRTIGKALAGVHRLGDHLGCVCAGDDNVIMFAVAFCKGKSLFHASCIGGKFDLRVLQGTLFHKSGKSFIGSNSQYTDFFYHLSHLTFINVTNLNILYNKFIEIERQKRVEYKTNEKKI